MISRIIADELGVKLTQVEATLTLLNEGATVPFIARYRKERTGGLTDTQLRTLEERLLYLRELHARRDVIIASIDEQGQLTPVLAKDIHAATTKARLEDIYLPYKPKRRTKAQIAIEAGLEPLANRLLTAPHAAVEKMAADFLNPDHNIHTVTDALDGAQFIVMERLAENADLLQALRAYVWEHGVLTSTVVKRKKADGTKFMDYFEYAEALSKVPSHRTLAVFRGQKEGILRVNIAFADDKYHDMCVQMIARAADVRMRPTLSGQWLGHTLTLAWKGKLKLKIDVDILVRLKEQAELAAMTVFKTNLHHLLMAAPAGKKITLGLDPGFRTGVKTVVLDDTGKLLAHTVIYPHAPQNHWDKALQSLAQLCEQHQVTLVSIGNGTASRETEKLVHALIKQYPAVKLTPVVVSEAGASVYSASELAANEFPTLDVSYRGAISIARRLQDPLAELVKIDPKAIGVGQYQHDVNQRVLGKSLQAVMEDCVNAVGADVNTASVPLLKSIAGLNETVAQNIVTYREKHGRFADRNAIKKVPRLGDKIYEQAIGFLRIIDGKTPLDASAVHPETYGVVDCILQDNHTTIKHLMGDHSLLMQLTPETYVTDVFGITTVRDIIEELKKPGRDPRPAFKTATFKEGIETIADLTDGMQLEGTVTNVTNFGAFVDIGVHQDGLVHISEMADHFVSDPNTVVTVGQIVSVKVKAIDEARNRIQLTMKTGKPVTSQRPRKAEPASVKHGFAHSLKDALRR